MNLMLILQASSALATTPATTAIETPAAEMNLWQMFQYGGPIMYILVAMFALAVYLFIERLITLKQASKEDNSFMNRIKDYIYDGKIDAAKKLCHDTNTPTSRMVEKGISRLGRPMSDVLVAIENVGNLVCPASYDVGTHLNIVLVSVPEGEDKIAKYPVMFRCADLILITKTDLLPYFEYDIEKEKMEARKLKPNVDILEVNIKDKQSLQNVIDWINFKRKMR